VERSFLVHVYRYFPPILNIRYGQPEKNGDDYIVTGNKILKTKGFMNQFILDYKMYENTGVFQTSGIFYPTKYYSLGMGCTHYVNGIFHFMTNDHCYMFDSGVFDTREKKIYFFLNGKLLPFVLIEVPLSCCFLIVSVCN
jgi:hypothetical protein